MKDLMTALLFLVGVPVYPKIQGGFLVTDAPLHYMQLILSIPLTIWSSRNVDKPDNDWGFRKRNPPATWCILSYNWTLQC